MSCNAESDVRVLGCGSIVQTNTMDVGTFVSHRGAAADAIGCKKHMTRLQDPTIPARVVLPLLSTSRIPRRQKHSLWSTPAGPTHRICFCSETCEVGLLEDDWMEWRQKTGGQHVAGSMSFRVV